MPDRAFWQRALARDVGTDVVLFVRGSDGVVKRFAGRLAGVDDPVGPILEANGERIRVHDWDRLAICEGPPWQRAAIRSPGSAEGVEIGF